MSNIKYYEIIPIKHLLKNNRIAKSGEVVDGRAFINLQDSLERGFCKETDKKPGDVAPKKTEETTEETTQETTQETTEETTQETTEETTQETTEETTEEVDLTKMDKGQLIKYAQDNNIALSKSLMKKNQKAILDYIVEQSV